jgi:predicted dehydrogenase
MAGAGAGLLILKPESVRGYPANSAVRLGLLGCGGRGTTVATSMAKNAGARIVALADIFPDQLEKAKVTFDGIASSLGYAGPERSMMFSRLHAYQEMANAKDLDAIQISTPPYFHVEHLAAVVAAGKHAYCEKPLGVDVVQTKRALEIAKQAEGKVSVDVGFQIRSAPPFAELVKRVQSGAIGKIVSLDTHYYAPMIGYPDRPSSMSKDELRLRNWNWDLTLSGDIVVEQNIHVIDICNWILGKRPVAAYATGSRAVLQHFGNNFDNYQVNYTYPDGVQATMNSKQYGETKDFDVSERVYGSEGYSESPYSGPLRIAGMNPWEWKGSEAQTSSAGFSASGAFSDNLADADSEKDKGFINSISSGQFHNQIALGVDTARTAILARMAARQKKFITWDEMLKSNESLHLDMDLKQFA